MKIDFDPSSLTLARSQMIENAQAAQTAQTAQAARASQTSQAAQGVQAGQSLQAGRTNGAGKTEKLSPADERHIAEAKQAARDFETMFAETMLKTMRQTATPEENSNAMDIFQGMLDSEYAKAMTGNGELGVQNIVMDWMKSVDPKLSGALGGSSASPLGEARGGVSAATPANIPGRDAKAVENALKQYRLQQYQMQAALPVMNNGGFE